MIDRATLLQTHTSLETRPLAQTHPMLDRAHACVPLYAAVQTCHGVAPHDETSNDVLGLGRASRRAAALLPDDDHTLESVLRNACPRPDYCLH